MKYSSKSWLRKIGSLSGAIALAATTAIAAGCSVDDNSEIQEDRTNVTSEELSEGVGGETTDMSDPESLIGQSVTVRNTIAEAVGDAGFTLQTEDGEDILVINSSGQPVSLPSEDIPVQVTGEVARFVTADIESEYGLALDEVTYEDYEDRPAIIAQSIAPAPSIEQLLAYQDDFEDQLVVLKGDVRDVYSPDTMSLFEQGWVDDIGLIVVGVDRGLIDSDALQEGETYTVVGRTQPFDANTLSQEYDLGLEQDKLDEFSERYQRPVIVADDIYSSAVEK